jgi:hypothetical protein
MAANLENTLVYLTRSGADRLFGSESGGGIIGLPVVPTDPTLVSGTIVYGDTFAAHNGAYIGGCNSQDAFTTQRPDDATILSAQEKYAAHIVMLRERFGPCPHERYADVSVLQATPQQQRIPTLEERARRRKEGGNW